MSIAVMGEGETMGRHGASPGVMERVEERKRELDPDQVIVLGAGPSGLLAAHAVALAGREPVIFTAPLPTGEPAKSRIGGATYLHSPIPDITGPDPDATVKFRKIGTGAGYAQKVYGNPEAGTSWDKFHGEQPAWDLHRVYDELWTRYVGNMIPMSVARKDVLDFIELHPVVISSIPPLNYCGGHHQFPRRPIWVEDESDAADNEILYDGLPYAGLTVSSRYRTSNLFGRGSTEYAKPVPLAWPGFKVLATDCDCCPEVMRVGRFGKWMPGVLSDSAFHEVWKAMFDQFEGA